MRAASEKSEQLDSALSEYLRPSDLEDEETRENDNPNMYYETQSHKSGVEEKIEKNLQEESISKPSNKDLHFFGIFPKCRDFHFFDISTL